MKVEGTILENQDELEKERAGRLAINEIFYSLQGEGKFVGTPMIFVRTNICHVGCSFCDTKYTWKKVSHNVFYTPEELLLAIHKVNDRCNMVCITGGEPLEQLDSLIPTVKLLKEKGVKVQLETSGSIEIPKELSDNCFWVVCSPKRFEAKNFLSGINEIKILITENTREDYVRGFIRKFSRKIWVSLQPIEPYPPSFGNPEGLSEVEVEERRKSIEQIYEKEKQRWRKNVDKAVQIALNTGWKLSLQLHKHLGVR